MKATERSLRWQYKACRFFGGFFPSIAAFLVFTGLLPFHSASGGGFLGCLCVVIGLPLLGYWLGTLAGVKRQQYVSREVLRCKCRLFAKVAAADPVKVKGVVDRHIKNHARNDDESGLMPSSNYAGILATRISNHVQTQVEFKLDASERRMLGLMSLLYPLVLGGLLGAMNLYWGDAVQPGGGWLEKCCRGSSLFSLMKIPYVTTFSVLALVVACMIAAKVILCRIAKRRQGGDEIALKVENENATVSALLAGVQDIRMADAFRALWHYAGAAYKTSEGIWKALAKAYRPSFNSQALLLGLAWLVLGGAICLLDREYSAAKQIEITKGLISVIGVYAMVAIPYFQILVRGRRVDFASQLIKDLEELEPVVGKVRKPAADEPVLAVERVPADAKPADRKSPRPERFSVDDFRVRRGEHVGIIGLTGSGKSTLLKALVGELELKSHTVSLLGNNPRQIPSEILAEWVGYVPQKPYVFNATIRENILLGRVGTVSDDRLLEVVKRLELESLVSSKNGRAPSRTMGKDALDCMLSANGVDVSGGEAVKIALARILVRETPQVILLDEPTDFLDQNARSLVLAIVEKEFRDRTLLFVSHRPSMLEHMDRILVMDGGRIVDEGRFADLIRRPGIFAKLHALETGQATSASLATIVDLPEGDWERRVRSVLGMSMVFSGVNWTALAKLAQSARERKFKQGERVVGCGERGDSMFAVVDGELDIKGGKFKRGDCFGEIALFSEDAKRTADVFCTADCTLAELTREDVFRICEYDAATSIRILKSVAGIVAREARR